MPASGVWACERDRYWMGKRNVERVGSGKGIFGVMGWRGRFGKLIPRVSASMRSSRAVMTQSTSRTGVEESEGDGGRQYMSVSSSREASSFLSKQGITETCQIWSGRMWRRWLRTVLRRVPVSACGDFKRERWGSTCG